MAQHWGRRGANLSESKDVRSERKKSGENSRQMAPVSTICDEYCRTGSFTKGMNKTIYIIKSKSVTLRYHERKIS